MIIVPESRFNGRGGGYCLREVILSLLFTIPHLQLAFGCSSLSVHCKEGNINNRSLFTKLTRVINYMLRSINGIGQTAVVAKEHLAPLHTL